MAIEKNIYRNDLCWVEVCIHPDYKTTNERTGEYVRPLARLRVIAGDIETQNEYERTLFDEWVFSGDEPITTGMWRWRRVERISTARERLHSTIIRAIMIADEYEGRRLRERALVDEVLVDTNRQLGAVAEVDDLISESG